MPDVWLLDATVGSKPGRTLLLGWLGVWLDVWLDGWLRGWLDVWLGV
jgi:hypothetical protein